MLRRAWDVLERNWRDEGFTAPNAEVYPWQWLWDSCFHAVVWSALGAPDRAVRELRSVFAGQGTTGFVPHMRYVGSPREALPFWRREGTSSITQPPMYGHAVARLARAGTDVGDLTERAAAAIGHLLARPRTPAGLVPVFHPWESGCDDSPRWDGGGGFDDDVWYRTKGELVGSLRFDSSGAPVANPGFTVGSAGFNALVVFNARELSSVGVPVPGHDVEDLARALASRHDPALRTWVDDGDRAGRAARTLDALLPALLGLPGTRSALADLVDPSAFGAPFGPAGVHRDEPSRDPGRYWRGTAWPQLGYLCWLAATSSRSPSAGSLASSLSRAMWRSGFAEYWNPDTGEGLGARPQSWATLGAVVG